MSQRFYEIERISVFTDGMFSFENVCMHFLQHINDSSLAAKEIKSICSFIQQSVHASFETPTGRSFVVTLCLKCMKLSFP